MNLGFKDRFVPMIEDGSKTHTIRAGSRWKLGMRADLFARPRQKGMRLLFRAMVTKVENICIFDEPGEGPQIIVGGVRLDQAEADLFAWRDGFRHMLNGHPSEALGTGGCFELMMDFWAKTHNLAAKPFTGQVIHWSYAERFMEKPKKAKKPKRGLLPVGPMGNGRGDWSEAGGVW